MLIVVTVFLFISCDEQTSGNNQNDDIPFIEQVSENSNENASEVGVAEVGATLSADLVGAYVSAKAGAFFGSLFGPVGTGVGGVVGATLVGAVASYKTGAELSEKENSGILLPAKGTGNGGLIIQNQNYSTYNNQIDKVGFLHNQIVKVLWNNPSLNSNSDLNLSEIYSISKDYLLTQGFSNQDFDYFTYQNFLTVYPDLGCHCNQADIIETINNSGYSSNANNYIRNLVNDIYNTNNPEEIKQLILEARSNIVNQSFSANEKDFISKALAVGEYSLELWKSNINTIQN